MFTHPVTDAHADHARHANAYASLTDTRQSPTTRATYRAFAGVVLAQWRALVPVIRFQAWSGGTDGAYANSGEMIADVRERWHLWVFPTDETQLDATHPMSAPLSAQDRLPGLVTLNDAFRAVHDVLGHVASGGSFGVNGEMRAWLAHRDTMPADALAALWCETRGQASWTNAWADHASLPLSARPFAPQKAGVPPLSLV